MLGYLSEDIISSEKETVFRERTHTFPDSPYASTQIYSHLTPLDQSRARAKLGRTFAARPVNFRLGSLALGYDMAAMGYEILRITAASCAATEP